MKNKHRSTANDPKLPLAVQSQLPYTPDWRWLLDRDDSPWYPAARLFRQTAIGDWSGVVDRVAAELSVAAAKLRDSGAALADAR